MPERSPWLALYRFLSPLPIAALPAAAPFSAKLREGLAGRRGVMERWAAAAERLRGGIWFHVTSVGEYEQARPVIAALRERGDSPPVVVSHFSPSGYRYAQRRPCADLHDYLPFDDPSRMGELVSLLRPRLLVFVKFDCWPNLALAAAASGARLLLLAGTLQPRSARLWPIARPLFRDLFNRFTHLGVCTEADRVRFTEQLGVSCPVSVTGDTRADQVIARYEASANGAVARRLETLGELRLVLGSTWPRDERLWLPVLPDLQRRFPGLSIVLVPHEPTPARLAGLEQELAARGLSGVRLSDLLARPAAAGPACVLVDSVGLLAEIYRGGSLAYVGGSFTTGVHNTLEPAVAGLPLLFGPVIQNAVEAGVITDREAGWVVRQPSEALARASSLLGDATLRQRAGEAARAVVLESRGATRRSLALLQDYV